jgi:hypothetical protein
MGRLARGKMVDHVGMEFFHEINPRRAAARNERKLGGRPGEPFYEFGRLLHDGDVRAEIRVEHGAEPHAPQRGIQFSGKQGAGGKPERLADRHADCRGDLDDAVGVLIAQFLPHVCAFVVFDDRSDRAVGRTLSAVHARRIGKLDVAGRGHARLEPAVKHGERPDVLHLLADLGATAARDAFARFEDDRAGGAVGGQIGNARAETCGPDAEIRGKPLQLAVVVAAAGQAFIGVPRKDELDHRPAHLDDLGIVRGDRHVLLDRGAAGAQHLVRPGHLDNAYSARRARREVGVFAQGRYPDLHRTRSVEDGGAVGHVYRNSVYGRANHRLSPCHCFEFAHFKTFSAFDTLRRLDEKPALPVA